MQCDMFEIIYQIATNERILKKFIDKFRKFGNFHSLKSFLLISHTHIHMFVRILIVYIYN